MSVVSDTINIWSSSEFAISLRASAAVLTVAINRLDGWRQGSRHNRAFICLFIYLHNIVMRLI